MQPPHYRTLDHDDSEHSPSEQLHSISSTGNTNKMKPRGEMKRDDSRSQAARSDEASIKGSTFQRGTGMSIFPSLNRNGGKGTSKILDRIMEIEKAKQ
jgi:hypothetical protein